MHFTNFVMNRADQVIQFKETLRQVRVILHTLISNAT
jgi:hypothetical protein